MSVVTGRALRRFVETTEEKLRRVLAGEIAPHELHSLVADLVGNRRRARIVGVLLRQGQERLLELPRRCEIASRFLGANFLANQRCLLERSQSVIGSNDLPRLLERGELQSVIACFLIEEAQVPERLDELFRVV